MKGLHRCFGIEESKCFLEHMLLKRDNIPERIVSEMFFLSQLKDCIASTRYYTVFNRELKMIVELNGLRNQRYVNGVLLA